MFNEPFILFSIVRANQNDTRLLSKMTSIVYLDANQFYLKIVVVWSLYNCDDFDLISMI